VIDFSAIENEILDICTGAHSFKSSLAGRIREVIPNSEMPSCDVACTEHEGAQRAGYEDAKSGVMIVIRCSHMKRTTAENNLKIILENLRAALETSGKGTSFCVLRDITSRATDEPEGEGSPVRVGIITLLALT